MEKIVKKVNLFESIPAQGNARYSEAIRGIDEVTGGRGVYAIYDTNKSDTAPVYVGSSDSNLYGTLTRHFQSWASEQYRVVFPARPQDVNRYKVDIFTVSSSAVLAEAERALILALDPEMNYLKTSPIDKEATELVKEQAEQAAEAIEEAERLVAAVEEERETLEEVLEEVKDLEREAFKAELEGESEIADDLESRAEELEEKAEEQAELVAELEAAANIEIKEAKEETEQIPIVIMDALPDALKEEESKNAAFIQTQNTKAATALAFAERERKRKRIQSLTGILKPKNKQ